jgi:hypothetical protein
VVELVETTTSAVAGFSSGSYGGAGSGGWFTLRLRSLPEETQGPFPSLRTATTPSLPQQPLPSMWTKSVVEIAVAATVPIHMDDISCWEPRTREPNPG